MTKIRALLADDEPLGRRALARLLGRDPRFELIAEAGDGAQALHQIVVHRPEVAFLDLAMPALSGIQVAAQCREPKPCFVFVTAHDRYAVEAFDEAALDYVLKPIDPLRFGVTLDRVVAHLTARRPRTSSAAEEIRVTIQSAGRSLVFEADELTMIEADGNYLELSLDRGKHRVRMTMQSMLDRLRGAPIVRVHRGFAVHLGKVRSFEVTDGAHAARVVLRNGEAAPVGRTHRPAFEEALRSYGDRGSRED